MMGTEQVRKRVTLAEIAREAEVSVGLVSAFLSGRSYGRGAGSGIRIGPETAGRIVETCRRLEYQPDRAQTYRLIYPERSPVGIVGSLHDRFQTNRYHSMILDGVIGATTTHSLNLNVLQYNPDTDYEAHPGAMPDWVTTGDIRRFVFAGPPNQSLLRILLALGADLVYASRDPGVEGVSAVVPDYAGASAMALRFLHGLGHRQIGLFGLPYFHGTYQARELLKGARGVLGQLQLAEVVCLDPQDSPDAHRSFDLALDRFLSRDRPVSAIFAFDDLSAETLVTAALRRGLRVPGDLSIIGCNDERQAAFLNPPLTTVHFPVSDIGRQAVDLLQDLSLHRQQAPARQIVLPVHLVERASTRPR